MGHGFLQQRLGYLDFRDVQGISNFDHADALLVGAKGRLNGGLGGQPVIVQHHGDFGRIDIPGGQQIEIGRVKVCPKEALSVGAALAATGRSDYPNRMNNVLVSPGIFRGAPDARASDINEDMQIAAAYAIAGLVSDEALNAKYIIPAAFDPRMQNAVAAAVAEAARKSGVARM
ncbi:hypothetical protein SDC9_46371 [bioreactor metagenome]|uniref:Malic enzyme NAD-binding domain-containing protein n=1 Tax=bioreactor metagenome TaxID=1076179 RepID=A0A644W9F4_9ZZZZ